jgi:hypothetical protein
MREPSIVKTSNVTPLVRVLFALAIVFIGLVLWMAADVSEALAARHERVATFQDVEESSSSRWRAPLERLLDAPAPTRASIDYWKGRYDTLTSNQPNAANDAASLMFSANAFFRKAQRQAGGQPPSVEWLDQAVQAYASVLKNAGFDRDAAYNYELVARLRDSVARAKVTPPVRQTRAPAARRDDDLPSGATIHGRPGTHPPNTRGEDFEVLTPMDYGDREAQPEPTPGQRLPRKG